MISKIFFDVPPPSSNDPIDSLPPYSEQDPVAPASYNELFKKSAVRQETNVTFNEKGIKQVSSKNCPQLDKIERLVSYLIALLKTLFNKLFSREFRLDFMNKSGETCYIDMGLLYGSYVTGSCINWWPEPVNIDPTKVNTYLDAMFAQLTKDGTKQINLSFAQISDIEALLNGLKTGSPNDTITQIFKDGYQVGNPMVPNGDNFLKYMNARAAAAGITVALSFGGANAAGPDVKINGDPTTQAGNLIKFMDNYGIGAVDFDIEGATALGLMTQNKPEDVVTFFSTLHKGLEAAGKSSVLTVAGSLGDGPTGVLKPLFDNFSSLFDGVNLMLYSNTEYYLDADNETWGISQWLNVIKDSSKIHLGFYTSIPYENPAASAGKQYPIPAGLTRGQAAAWLYLEVLKEMKQTPDAFGAPFWWTDNPSGIASDKVMPDFWAYLQKEATGRQGWENTLKIANEELANIQAAPSKQKV